MGDARQLFAAEEVAKHYVLARPTYPGHVFDLMVEYARAHGACTDRAADIATGSGQAARGLARVFENVVGVDASPAQVAAAIAPSPNVTFAVGTAESTGLQASSYDCVCVAEALHWFDRPRFWEEAMRILRPGGIIAILGYAAVRFPDEPTADAVYNKLFDDTLGPFWHPSKRLVDDLYRGCEPPAPPFVDVVRHDGLTIERDWSVDDAVGYANSWSGLETYLSQHGVARGSSADPAAVMRAELEAALASEKPQSLPGAARSTCRAVWPLTLILARKPV